MLDVMVSSLVFDSLKVTLMVAGPLLLATMTVGLTVSVFQAVTQINEATLSFIPKMVTVILIFILLGPWMMEVLSEYTIETFKSSLDWLR